VLVTVSTDGWCLPVLTVYKGATVQAQWISGKACHFTLYTTSGGLMEQLQCYEWFTSSFIVRISNVRMKKNMTIQAPLTTVVGHSIHISCHIMKAVIDKIFSLQLSWSADKLQPLV
jgi:hypothetical protein